MFGLMYWWLIYGAPSIARDTVLAMMMTTGGVAVELPSNPDVQGIASRFGDPGDKHIGGNLACKPEERVSLTEHQCAIRSKRYKCGTILIIENQRNKRKSWCEVADRGPYGANVYMLSEGQASPVYTSSGRKAWYVKKRKSHAPPEDLCPSGDCVGRWRGELDMSPVVSDELGHNGFEKVRVYRANSVIRHLRRLEAKARRKII
jgi:hypothetical protein